MIRMVVLVLPVLLLLPVSVLGYDVEQTVLGPKSTTVPREPSKSIAVVGAGTGGIAVLKTIFDLPEHVRRDWEVVLYEQRRSVGGIWLPDLIGPLPRPPDLPESPMYPLLHTVGPIPTMTYPNFTYPPFTPLVPSHEYVQRYHADYANAFNLTQYMHFHHTVVAANWKGDSEQGKWELIVHAHAHDGARRVLKRSFDHLVVANGHNHYPHVPQWNGTDEWLANTPPGAPPREILHSIYYRDPEKYANQTVVIVGAGASGSDVALQVSKVARLTYQSLTPNNETRPGAHVIPKPRISHFAPSSIVFEDGSSLSSVDALILCTGYEFRVPFLSSPHSSVLAVDPHTPFNSSTAPTLVTNLRYVFPTHRHIFALAPRLPPTALAFVGLPVFVTNCPSNIAQSLLIVHALVNPSILPTRAQMLDELIARENVLRAGGLDPYYVGHGLVSPGEKNHEYQEALVEYLKEVGAIPKDGRKFVETWRHLAWDNTDLLNRAWERAVRLGEDQQWLIGVQTEDEWADLMSRLAEWQRAYELEHGELATSTESSD